MARALVLVVALALAGCGADGGDDAAPGSTQTTVVTTTAPASTSTTLDPDAVLRRYASEFGPVIEDLPGLYDDLSDCILDKFTDVSGCEVRWGTQIFRAGTISKTIPLTFENLEQEVGVPSELDDLILETKVDASMVAEAAEAYDAAGCTWSSDSMECAGATGDIMGPLGLLVGQVERWDPYV